MKDQHTLIRATQTLLVLSLLLLSTNSFAKRNNNRTQSNTGVLKYSVELPTQADCSRLELSQIYTEDVIISANIADLRTRKGKTQGSVELAAGSYPLEGEIHCDLDGDLVYFEVSPFDFDLTAGDRVNVTLSIDPSAPISLTPEEPTCDSETWTDNLANIDGALSAITNSLQNLRMHMAMGNISDAQAAHQALSDTIDATLPSFLVPISEYGDFDYECNFAGCDGNEEIATQLNFSLHAPTMAVLNLANLPLSSTADLIAGISAVDVAISSISFDRAHIGARFQVLNTATTHQCSAAYEISTLHNRQEILAQVASSEQYTDEDRAALQLEFVFSSLEISRIAGSVGCDPADVNGCSELGCPSITTIESAQLALINLEQAMINLSECSGG